MPPPKKAGKDTIGSHIGGVAIALAVIVVLGVIVAVNAAAAGAVSNSAPEQLSYATPTIGDGKCDGTCSTWSATQEPSTPTPKPQPTKPPVQATQSACQGVNNNPWCYNFSPGNYIYNPPSAFCNCFTCVSTFWTATSGYLAECAIGSYTHSGGVHGACSHDGGVMRPLYSH